MTSLSNGCVWLVEGCDTGGYIWNEGVFTSEDEAKAYALHKEILHEADQDIFTVSKLLVLKYKEE